MRQAGILAAAGLHALEHHVERLEQDHKNAQLLARGLSEIKGIDIDPGAVQTNILFVDIQTEVKKLYDHLKENKIIIDPSSHLRLVTHLDITRQDIDHTIGAFKSFFI